jgi:4-amino-4-deoxy-L-arabinose transferase-like glycosyltransferase
MTSHARHTALYLIFISGLGLALRLVFPTADPPAVHTVGTFWVDEGAWVASARNRVLFGTWQLNQWNPLHVSPLFTGLVTLSYTLFGVGTWASRLPSMLLGAGLPLLAFATLRHEDRQGAWIAALFMATDYTLVSFARVAMLETTMVTLLAAAAWCLAEGLRDLPGQGDGRKIWLFASGVVSVVSVTAKASAFFFPIGLTLALAGLALLEGFGTSQGKKYRAALAWYLFGCAVMVSLWAILWILPTWQEYAFYQFRHYAADRVTLSVRGIGANVLLFPISKTIFARMPVATVFGVVATITLLAAMTQRLVSDSRRSLERTGRATSTVVQATRFRLSPVDVAHASWLWLGVATIIAFDTYATHRYVMVLPPLILLAARGISGGLSGTGRQPVGGPSSDARGQSERWGNVTSINELPSRWRAVWAILTIYPLYVLWGGLLAALPVRMRWIAPLAMLIAVLSAVWLAYRRDHATTYAPGWRPSAAFGQLPWAAAALLISIAAVVGVGQFMRWASARTYTIVTASRQIGNVVGSGVPVHGTPAVSLSLENHTRAYMVHQGITDLKQELVRETPWLVTYDLSRPVAEDSQFAAVLRHRIQDADPVLRLPVQDSVGDVPNVAVLWRARERRRP